MSTLTLEHRTIQVMPDKEEKKHEKTNLKTLNDNMHGARRDRQKEKQMIVNVVIPRGPQTLQDLPQGGANGREQEEMRDQMSRVVPSERLKIPPMIREPLAVTTQR